jgi:microcystin-dependent protein
MSGIIKFDNISNKFSFSQNLETNANLSVSTNDNTTATTAFVNAFVNSLMPTGMIIPYAGATAPSGWFLCDGSALSQTTYSKLFSAIGTVYGIAGPNTFKLPDLRGKTVIGTGAGFTLGHQGGAETVTLTTNNLPSHSHTGTTDVSGTHTHTASDSGHTHPYSDAFFAENRSQPNNNNFGTSSGTDNDNNLYTRDVTTGTGNANISVQSAGAHTHTFTTSSVGSANSFAILPPYVSLNYLIKYA